MSNAIKQAVAYVQEVTIRVPVVMTGREGDFDTVDRDDAAEAAIAYVRARLPERMKGATITAFRGPSGSRYYWPEEMAEGKGPDTDYGKGLTVPVGRIMA